MHVNRTLTLLALGIFHTDFKATAQSINSGVENKYANS